MFTQQTPCSITEHAVLAAKETCIHPVRQLDRHLRAADATYLHFPLKGRTCKHLRHVSRAASEERPGLREASKLFVEGLEKGIDEDELLARQIGLTDPSQMSSTQEKYKERIKQKLLEQAAKNEAEKAERYKEFTLGKYAYGKGQYQSSTQLFTAALDREGPFSPMGGEIQLWLALAYQATGREQDCISMYRSLEETHPSRKIKQQAANLRFIMEAPKLKLGPDERVKIPVFENSDRFVKERNASRPRPPPLLNKQPQRKRELTWEERFFEEYKPPNLVPNKYILVAAILIAISLAVYSTTL